MEKRFGLKDFILFAGLVVVLLSVWLLMFQVDRQWEFISKVEKQIEEQSKDLSELRRLVRSGRPLNSLSEEANQDPDGAWQGFARVAKITDRKDYAAGDWIVDAFSVSSPTMTPLVAGDAYAAIIQQLVLDTLATRDPETLEWLPLIATEWSSSSDGLTFTFVIRDGVRFADGEALNAEDIEFTFRFLMDSKIAAPRVRAYFNRIESVVASGSTVTFQMSEPYFESFEIIAQMPILAEHFYGQFLESTAKAEEFNTSTNLLFGSGPYRMANVDDWLPGQMIELVPNERYWGALPGTFSKLIFKTITTDTARLTEFKNGDLDIYGARPLEYRQLMADQTIVDRTNNFEYFNPRGGYSYIAWNQLKDGKPTAFANPKVRQAMTYLTDRQRIIDEIYLGYAVAANGPFNPLGSQMNKSLPTRDYNLQKAKQLLKESGFIDRDGDGVIESEGGQPFSFELTYPSGSDDYKRMMLLLKDSYVRAGILMEPTPTQWPMMIEALDKKNFDAISLAWTAGFEVDVYQMLHSSQTEPGGDNFMNYKNADLDQAIELARGELDEEKRMAHWQQAHEIIWEDQPYTYLTWRKSLAFVDGRFENVRTVRSGLNRGGLWRMPIEWYVTQGQQRYSN
ncbi:MAG: ABC transporter substrate-binding protein [Proteobacteria bacterium TMED261]|nr:MAG: ABC transporter substrate-binding protein [Proteobacteria bacterium TMED261]